MAKIKSDGITELAEKLKELDGDILNITQDMLNEGAKECKSEWEKGIDKAGHVDTGEMLKSVGISKTKKKQERIIYPKGKVTITNKNGKERTVRNAEKAYVLHYGSSHIKGDRFVDKIDENSEPKTYTKMQEVLDKYLESKGLK